MRASAYGLAQRYRNGSTVTLRTRSYRFETDLLHVARYIEMETPQSVERTIIEME
jgi:hypothetical protein